MTIDEMKEFLNVDSDNTAHDGTIADLIAAARHDLFVATGKTLDDDNPLVRQYIKLYSRIIFDNLDDDMFISKLMLDIKCKILLSTRFSTYD